MLFSLKARSVYSSKAVVNIKGKSDVFVYYSGHGVPDKEGNDISLIDILGSHLIFGMSSLVGDCFFWVDCFCVTC